MTLLPRSRARPSSALLDGVYLHQFGDETLDGVPGLVGKPLLDSDGFSGESVWYDALSPDPFVAKCLEPVEAGARPSACAPSICPAALPPSTPSTPPPCNPGGAFDGEMRKWLGQIGAW